MFSTVVIHASQEKAPLLRAMVAAAGSLEVMREFYGVPGPYELRRVMNTLAPDVVLVDFSLGESAMECAAHVAEHEHKSAAVAFGVSPAMTLTAKQAGFHAVVGLNSSTEDLERAVREALHNRNGGVEPSLFCFLPSKAGSRASTIVLNTAIALAKVNRKRVLVIDADLRSGILAIMLGVEPDGSLQTLLAGAEQLDQFKWRHCAVPIDGVDFLMSSRSLDSEVPEWAHYYQVLNFARGQYDAILVDLPELVNPATVELVRRAAMVYPVCTPEIPALRLTQHRCEELKRWGVPAERVGVILNRWHKMDPEPEKLAAMLGKQILQVLPNDYPSVKAAVSAGTHVSYETPLGRAVAEFAGVLAHEPYIVKEPSLGGKLKGFFGLATA